MSAFGPAAAEDRHLDAPRMSMLVYDSQVTGLTLDAEEGGFHVHLGREGETTPTPVEAGPGETWITICSGPVKP